MDLKRLALTKKNPQLKRNKLLNFAKKEFIIIFLIKLKLTFSKEMRKLCKL